MPDVKSALPPALQHPLLQTPHAMFCRLGGVSAGPFAALNLSCHVGDKQTLVQENRRRALAALGLRQLVALQQVHADRVLLLDRMPESGEFSGFDAVITNVPGLALLIQQADCQAVLLHAPGRRVVAAVHCGWRGSVANIIGKTVARMRSAFGVRPAELRAVVSPSLGPCCAEFINYKQELPAWMHAFAAAGKPTHFDFWAMSARQLATAGIPAAQIGIMGICTCCNHGYFSFRRAKRENGGLCGRNGSMIGLAAR